MPKNLQSDVDECALDDTLCTNPNTFCNNFDGGYDCQCDPGYQGDPEAIRGCSKHSNLQSDNRSVSKILYIDSYLF